MAITLDYSKGDNTFAIYETLPDDSTGALLLDFKSDYTGEDFSRPTTGVQKGAWVIGTIEQDRIPYTGTYELTVHDTVQDHLALKDIHLALKDIHVALKDIVGPSRSEMLATLAAIVIGNDKPTITKNNAKVTSITSPEAKVVTINQPAAVEKESKTNRL